MKKRLTIAAAAVLLISLTAYGTLAYLTAEGTAHNVITAGSVQIELLDKLLDGETPLEECPDFPEDGVKIMPGATVEKGVAVRKVVGSAPCWVRVRLEQTIRMAGETAPRPVAEGEPITLELADQDWLAPGDGWYYFSAPLTDEAGQTSPLLSGVQFGPGMGNEYQGADYVIDVTVQAVQKANNGDAVLEAAGWPAAPAPQPTPAPTPAPQPTESAAPAPTGGQ